MKEFTIPLLGVIFVTLIAGSIQSISADHLESDQGIFKDENNVNIASTKDSKYQIHLQVEVRNAQERLVSVLETMGGKYLAHEITDQIFDKMAGKREIVIINKIKYEKIQNVFTYDAQSLLLHKDMRTAWSLEFVENVDGHGLKRLPTFQAVVPVYPIAEGDILTFHWTFLREIN